VTQDEVRKSDSIRNGIQEWAKKGIAGRGVLIDYYSHMQETDSTYEPWSGTQIPVATIEEIALKCGIEFRTGDILFLRTGFVPSYEKKSEDELKALMGSSEMHYPGLAQREESLEWLWETHFAAVAADSPGFEAWDGTGIGTSKGQTRLHEAILSGFGLPIGELFDLEALAEECKKQKRWEFFVTSMPLNLYGGVGSPPNAMAIF
jgi:kynurenine formamidase